MVRHMVNRMEIIQAVNFHPTSIEKTWEPSGYEIHIAMVEMVHL